MGIFDKNHYHQHGTQFVSVTSKVTEHRAPTDESVKLLREMEDSAMSNIVHRLKQEDNVFGDVLVMQRPMSCGLVVAFKLNGKQYQIDIDEREIMLVKADPVSYASALYESMARAIAEKLLVHHVFKKL